MTPDEARQHAAWMALHTGRMVVGTHDPDAPAGWTFESYDVPASVVGINLHNRPVMSATELVSMSHPPKRPWWQRIWRWG